MPRTRNCGAGHDVVDEQPADAQPHRIRLDEKIVELASATPDREHHREAEKAPASIDRNSHPAVGDRPMRWLDRIRMRREFGAVLLPDIRRAALERLQSGRLVRPRIPNRLDDVHHELDLPDWGEALLEVEREVAGVTEAGRLDVEGVEQVLELRPVVCADDVGNAYREVVAHMR